MTMTRELLSLFAAEKEAARDFLRASHGRQGDALDVLIDASRALMVLFRYLAGRESYGCSDKSDAPTLLPHWRWLWWAKRMMTGPSPPLALPTPTHAGGAWSVGKQ